MYLFHFCFLFLQQSALYAPIIGQVMWILIAWTPAIVALVTIIRKLKADARQRITINVEQTKESEHIKEIVMAHTAQIKELTAPEIVKDMTILKTTVLRHDDELKRLENMHQECAMKQNEVQMKIFQKLDELTDKIDYKFSALLAQIIDIYKGKR